MKKLLNNKKIQILFKTIKIIITILVLIIISIILVQRISKNKVTLGGFGFYTIISESMLPKYKIGDMIISKQVPASTIKVGDDVVYKGKEGDFKDKIVTHQVVEIKENTFVTKGINNLIEDPEITSDQIYGIVLFKPVFLSFLSRIVSNTYGFYFIIFVPLTIMIFLEIVETIKEKEEEKHEEEK